MAVGDRANFSGDVTLVAPTGGVVRGNIYLIADSYWVARETADAAANFLAANPAVGAVEVAKIAGAAMVVGDKIFVKTAAVAPATSTGASLVLGGVGVLVAAASAATVVTIGPIAMTNNVT